MWMQPPANVGFSSGRGGFSLPGLPPISFLSAVAPVAPQPPYVPLLIKNDPQFKKYFKLRDMGMPAEQVKLKMKAEELDPDVLDRPDDVSPNDAGVSPLQGVAVYNFGLTLTLRVLM
jgi:hypothetical protein